MATVVHIQNLQGQGGPSCTWSSQRWCRGPSCRQGSSTCRGPVVGQHCLLPLRPPSCAVQALPLRSAAAQCSFRLLVSSSQPRPSLSSLFTPQIARTFSQVLRPSCFWKYAWYLGTLFSRKTQLDGVSTGVTGRGQRAGQAPIGVESASRSCRGDVPCHCEEWRGVCAVSRGQWVDWCCVGQSEVASNDPAAEMLGVASR